MVSTMNKSEIMQEGKKGEKNLTQGDSGKGASEEVTFWQGSQ